MCHRRGDCGGPEREKPSVSLAMKQLKERGLVEYTQYSPIVLTKSGRHEADRVISCHTMVKEFLMTVLHMEERARMKWPAALSTSCLWRKFPDSSCSRTMSGNAGSDERHCRRGSHEKGGFPQKEPFCSCGGREYIPFCGITRSPAWRAARHGLAPGALA